MSVTYEIKDLGRGKWCGEVRAQTDRPEHVEAALLRAAEKHLRSASIDFNGDTESGKFIVGMGAVVGEYRRVRIGTPSLLKENRLAK